MRDSHEMEGQIHMPAVGWISLADSLLFGLVFVLAVALGMVMQLRTKIDDNKRLEDKNARLQTASLNLQRQIDDLKKEIINLNEIIATKENDLHVLRILVAKYESELHSLRELLAMQVADGMLLAKKIETLELDNERLSRTIQRHFIEMVRLFDEIKRLKQLTGQTDETKTQLTQTEEKVTTLQMQLMQEQERNKKSQAKVDELEAEVKKLQGEVERFSNGRGKINQELVGLKGDMRNVAFVIDSSSSMLENNRWEFSHQVLNTWLQHLEVGHCVIITFNAEVQIFPKDGELRDLRGVDAAKNRREMLDFLKSIKPDGGTNTRAALSKAYSIPGIDTIVLFTDGAPNNGKSAVFDRTEAIEIYELVKANKTVPINAVGLGNYFKGETAEFLMKIKELSNGTFLGR